MKIDAVVPRLAPTPRSLGTKTPQLTPAEYYLNVCPLETTSGRASLSAAAPGAFEFLGEQCALATQKTTRAPGSTEGSIVVLESARNRWISQKGEG